MMMRPETIFRRMRLSMFRTEVHTETKVCHFLEEKCLQMKRMQA